MNTPQGLWTPKNASNKFYGPTPMRTGIEQSRNLMTIRIAEEIGMETVAGYAERFGVYDRMNPFLANALGAQETTLLQDGRGLCDVRQWRRAGGADAGRPGAGPLWPHDLSPRPARLRGLRSRRLCRAARASPITSNRERVMDAITAYQLTSMLEGVVQRGTARGINLPVPIAGKTGTTNDAKDVWFIGYLQHHRGGLLHRL